MKRSLMEILACPICKRHPLELRVFKEGREVEEGLILCPSCGRWYPIIEEIPHMLPDELRDKEEDLSFLEKWKEKIPRKVLEEGKPYSLEGS
ncbi:TPA: Trm112 family protein [Candidatus Bathyarchaeota archaeon]|nr:Trm112 family protein [Candidatus Bathyarchaeota archaeon]